MSGYYYHAIIALILRMRKHKLKTWKVGLDIIINNN